ncbi:MAG: class I adenylate-forming enzyme family protein [Chloroflexota bacterium]
MDTPPSDRIMLELASLPVALARWSEVTPDAPALLAPGGESFRYGDLHAGIVDVRARLRALGIGHADRIAFTPGTDARSAFLLVAVMCSAVAAPLSPGASGEELRGALVRLRPAAVLAARRDRVGSIAASLGIPVLHLAPTGDPFRFTLEGEAAAPPADAIVPHLDDVAVILTTSGTTGRPRFVPRRHRMLAIIFADIRRQLGLGPADLTLQTAPTEHAFGQVHLTSLLHAGGAIVCPGEVSATVLRSLLDAWPVTYLHILPALLARLVETGCAEAGTLPAGFRAFKVGAAPLDSRVREHAESVLGIPVLDGYGLSEAPNLAAAFLDRPRRPGMVGQVLNPMRVMNGTVPAAPGETGELQVRGDRVFDGYFDDPVATAAAFTPDGWFRTGDRGRIEDGCLALAGREAETINASGRKVDPGEVEAALGGYPGIREAAAFALPDPIAGQQVALAVVREPGAALNRRALRRHLLDRLSPWKMPKTIVAVDALPRTSNGKIRRSALAERFADG